MSIKHPEIEIKANNPFDNCKLGRQKYAEVLTSIINSYSDGFVLAIDNKWGTGKTTFVKMWEQDLKDKEYQTVYFNAWENDFENNPLTALMGELKTLTKEETEPEFKTVLKQASLLSKHIAPIVIQAIADKYIDTKGIKDAIVGVTKGLSDVFENDVNEYAKKKKSISDFRKSLSEFIANTNQGKPLVFIIDELDRCRPNYAVSILEQIKHFFNVPNIVFVLSIDKTQLGNAIRGVYGSDRIDSDEYLRRFIDIEYSIPEPEAEIYYKYLYEYFNFDEFFQSEKRNKYRELPTDRGDFIDVCNIIFTNTSLTLRIQEKIFALARLSLRSFNENQFVVPYLFLFLIYIKIVHSEFYDNLKDKHLTIKQVQDKFSNIFNTKKNEDTQRALLGLEANLVNFYNNYYQSSSNFNRLFEYDPKVGGNKLLISSIINPKDDDTFLRILENIHNYSKIGPLKLSYFINRIDLLETIKM